MYLFRPKRLLISAEIPTYMFIPTYTFINFCTFLWPILTSDDLRSHFEATIGNLNQQLINCKSFYWNSKQTCNTWHICEVSDSYTLLNATKKSHLYFYSDLYVYYFSAKNPTYTFIPTYTLISF